MAFSYDEAVIVLKQQRPIFNAPFEIRYGKSYKLCYDLFLNDQYIEDIEKPALVTRVYSNN